jgi:hypothetical protein
MTPDVPLSHEFVESVPDVVKERTLYVSIKFATVIHKCCCGCGREVVTPLSPTGWSFTFDGKTLSLHPSIGSWSLPCQSHYWIRNNKAIWAPRWTEAEIRAGRAQEALAKKKYFERVKTPGPKDADGAVAQPGATNLNGNLWQRLKKWFFG